MVLTAIGAYGRLANEADWRAGKDFQVYGGPYFSIRDVARLKADGYRTVQFVDRQAKIVFVVTL